MESLSVSISRNKRQYLVSTWPSIVFLFMYASSQFSVIKEKLFWVKKKLLLSKHRALIFNFFNKKLIVEVNCIWYWFRSQIWNKTKVRTKRNKSQTCDRTIVCHQLRSVFTCFSGTRLIYNLEQVNHCKT